MKPYPAINAPTHSNCGTVATLWRSDTARYFYACDECDDGPIYDDAAPSEPQARRAFLRRNHFEQTGETR